MWRLRGLVAALRSYMACKPVEIGGVEASESIRRVLASRYSRSRKVKMDALMGVGESLVYKFLFLAWFAYVST